MDTVRNPMVEYLNSLRTQQQSSNSTYIHEARRDFLLSLQRDAPWFPDENRLQVRTRLDTLANDLAKGGQPISMLFLTGDAGDGKTAFCAALAHQLGFDGDLQPETSIGSWRIIKDASEIEEEVLAARIEEQLQAARTGGLIVAINEGRLRRLFRRLSTKGQTLWREVVEPALEGWLDSERAKALDQAMRLDHVLVVNFRHRFHLRAATPNLLDAWTAQSLWEDSPACGNCPARARCPILANVQDLRDPLTEERIADVLAYSHFSGQRLPFRRLQAVLALATTGGLLCFDVQSPAIAEAPTIVLLRHRYYNALFLRDDLRAPVAVRPEPIARSFAGADPGSFVVPELDRRIEDLLGPQREAPRWREAGTLPRLEAEATMEMRRRLHPGGQPADVQDLQADLSRLTRFLRRWAMFADGVSPEMGWRRALELVEAYAEQRDQGNQLRRTVVEAINRLHRVEEMKTESITGNQIDAAGFRTPARQVLELNLHTEFLTELRCGPALPEVVRAYLESSPTEIFLTAWPEGTNGNVALLPLDARLVEILLSVTSGFLAWQGLGTYRRALARFHAQLLALASRAGHRPVVTIRTQEKRYSVSVVTSGGSPRLRFEGQG
jgi:hypothetical protein